MMVGRCEHIMGGRCEQVVMGGRCEQQVFRTCIASMIAIDDYVVLHFQV